DSQITGIVTSGATPQTVTVKTTGAGGYLFDQNGIPVANNDVNSIIATAGPIAFSTFIVGNAGLTGSFSFNGIGITQSAGSTVNGGSGMLTINGGGSTINMAGALSTTSNAANAMTVQNATAVVLPAITTGATGTTTIGVNGDITGAVTQNGSTAISTGTLAGSTSGTVTLTNGISIASLGNFATNGSFSLVDGT